MKDLKINIDKYEINWDQQTFSNVEKDNTLTLDFKNETVVHKSGDYLTKTPLAKSFLEKGQFFLVGPTNFLWLARPRVVVPAEWNKNGKKGFQTDTVVIIYFSDGKEKYRLSRSDLNFTQIIHKPEEKINHPSRSWTAPESEIWLSRQDVYIPFPYSLAVRPTSTVHFVAKLYLTEAKDGKSVEIDIHTGHIKGKVFSEKPVIDSSIISKKMIEDLAEFNQKVIKLSEWYKHENKLLAEKIKTMSDKEVNAAVEKLTADFNRKNIEIQASNPISEGMDDSKK